MKFLYPQFLYALALIAIPIIIHLFNFRKFKTIYFSNVQFLRSVNEKTKSKSQLKHILILSSRVLTIAALVMAFSQPYLPVNKDTKQTKKYAACIYVDNSFSMNSENKDGRLLLIAKQKAKAISEVYSNNDELFLIDNNFRAINQRSMNKEIFLNALNKLEISSKTNSLNQVYKRQKNILENCDSDQKHIYIISDFQQTISDISLETNDSIYLIRFIPIEPYRNANLYIDSCWLNTPNPIVNENIKIYARVKNNNSNIKREVNLTLEINGKQKALASQEILSESVIELNFNLNTKGWHNGKLSLKDHPITFDDHFYFSFEIKDKLNIYHIFNEYPHKSIEKLFKNDEYYDLKKQNTKQINYSNLEKSQFIILDGINQISSGLQQSLKNAIKNGSSVIIFPNDDIDLLSYNQFSQLMNIDSYDYLTKKQHKIKYLDKNHSLFEGVFERIDERMNFPEVNQFYEFKKKSKASAISILSFENNKGFLNEYNFSKGKIYLSSIGLDKSFGNFCQHALFVPIMYNISSHAGGKQDLFYSIGQENIPFITSNYSAPLKISNINNEFIPEISNNGLWISDQISKADNYELKKDNKTLAYISFNYDRKESDVSILKKEKIKKILKNRDNAFLIEKETENLREYLKEFNNGIPLWFNCIIFSLFFLFLETILIRIL